MPIPVRCPACGNTSLIVEQYAGQNVPCQACGQPMLVAAMAPGMPGPMPAPSSGMPTIVIVLAVVCVALLVCGGGLAALLLPAVQAARSAARRAQSQNNLKQLSLALLTYESAYKVFPPAVVRDADGKPLYSGFVLLLPFLEQQNLFSQFHQDEPWDSPHNARLSRIPISVFLDPGAESTMSNRSDYQFVTGPGTMFEEGRPITVGAVRDGLSSTVTFVEVQGSTVPWAAPGGWDASRMPAGNYPAYGVIAATADGAVHGLRDLDPETWRRLTDRADGMPVNFR